MKYWSVYASNNNSINYQSLRKQPGFRAVLETDSTRITSISRAVCLFLIAQRRIASFVAAAPTCTTFFPEERNAGLSRTSMLMSSFPLAGVSAAMANGSGVVLTCARSRREMSILFFAQKVGLQL